RFIGCYDLLLDQLILMSRTKDGSLSQGITMQGLGDPALEQHVPPDLLATLREEVEMARGLCPPFDLQAYLQGHMTPIYFGSALHNFGVRELIHGLGQYSPAPKPHRAVERVVEPGEEAVTGFVFKIQANMDPKHRDRVAFIRLCSGHFSRGMKLHHVRTGALLRAHNPLLFLAQDRELAEEAWAGDIIGLPNHGKLRVGDTLTEGEALHFAGLPSFAPELLQTVRPDDPVRAKHLGKALEQLAEEGAASVFKTHLGSTWVVGVVGGLQFDVLADRVRTEYDVPVRFEGTQLYTARWVEGDPAEVKRFKEENRPSLADDHTGALVFLARNAWHLERAEKDYPKLTFAKVKEQAPA
ncbi:MAG TPA: EF-Tu/IF-2/RF-3 family GTPase, partial [Polyangiaceae bacterium]|nr:EF-Tu/IF-2/RF-3 family GTPase [Polyangiaceae bacterium]